MDMSCLMEFSKGEWVYLIITSGVSLVLVVIGGLFLKTGWGIESLKISLTIKDTDFLLNGFGWLLIAAGLGLAYFFTYENLLKKIDTGFVLPPDFGSLEKYKEKTEYHTWLEITLSDEAKAFGLQSSSVSPYRGNCPSLVINELCNRNKEDISCERIGPKKYSIDINKI